MEIHVLIEPVARNGFRATSGPPLDLSAEAPTREKALAKLKEKLERRLRDGAELVPLPVLEPEHPLARFAGMYDPKDPLIKAWKRQMARNRRKRDADPSP